MIRSMTGFGAAEGEVRGTRVSVELRSVNHRFFSPSLKIPSAFGRWEGDVREALRRRVSRGHVTLTVRLDRDAASGGTIDERIFARHVEELRALKERYGLGGEVDLAAVLRMPALFAATEPEAEGADGGAFVEIVERAADELAAMRAQEGAKLADYLRERLAVVESAVGRIAERAPSRLLEQRDRLHQAVKELSEGITLDEQRMAQEIAILADRLDVSEELSRFEAHISAFREAISSAGPEGVGKRLGFLLQELVREANTTGSKANDAAMLSDVVAIKEELERLREQVENLE